MSRPSVVITGRGVVSGFGPGVDTLWRSVVEGRSCVGGGEDCPEKEPVEAISIGAAREALEQSGLGFGNDEVRLVLGTNVGRVSALSRIISDDLAADPLSDSWLHDWADHQGLATVLAKGLGLARTGPVLTAACASGLLALGYGHDLIATGEESVVLVGGADVCTEFKSAGHRALGTASLSGVVRPFDESRDGTSFREGAVFLVLEGRGHAIERGATALAEVGGYGISNDVGSLTAPDLTGAGAVQAMESALHDAGLSPTEIDHVQAHATGTRLNDEIEAAAIRRVFEGEDSPPTISADKGCIGHTFGASGLFSAVLAVQMIRRGCIPPIAGCRKPDATCRDLDLVLNQPLPKAPRIVLCNNFGFGGANVSCVIRAPLRGDT